MTAEYDYVCSDPDCPGSGHQVSQSWAEFVRVRDHRAAGCPAYAATLALSTPTGEAT
jgi:hypothetical protein